MTMKIRNCRIIRSSNCCFFQRDDLLLYSLRQLLHQMKFVLSISWFLIIWPKNFTVLSCGLVDECVCVLTLLHTTHKYHHVSKEQQQEESFQVIGQMRRITSSVWLTHGPRPFREVQTRPRTLSNWEVVSAPSFSFCCQLCLHFWPPSLLSLMMISICPLLVFLFKNSDL